MKNLTILFSEQQSYHPFLINSSIGDNSKDFMQQLLFKQPNDKRNICHVCLVLINIYLLENLSNMMPVEKCSISSLTFQPYLSIYPSIHLYICSSPSPSPSLFSSPQPSYIYISIYLVYKVFSSYNSSVVHILVHWLTPSTCLYISCPYLAKPSEPNSDNIA